MFLLQVELEAFTLEPSELTKEELDMDVFPIRLSRMHGRRAILLSCD